MTISIRSRARGARGFTLLEMVIAVTIFSAVVLMALQLEATTNNISYKQTVRQYAELQCKKITDSIAEDFRGSAAWCYFAVDPSTGAAMSTVTLNSLGNGTYSTPRLTQFVGGTDTTGDTVTGTSTGNFNFGPFDPGPTAAVAPVSVAFLRVRAHRFPATTPTYLIYDFEPIEPSSTVWGDLGSDGLSGSSATTNQPGRMNDDPNVAWIYYRTSTMGNRLVVERVRGLCTLNPGTSNGTPAPGSWVNANPFIVQVGDLGPSTVPTGASRGYISISAVQASTAGIGSWTGAGLIQIKVACAGVINNSDVVWAELTTSVAPMAATPPY